MIELRMLELLRSVCKALVTLPRDTRCFGKDAGVEWAQRFQTLFREPEQLNGKGLSAREIRVNAIPESRAQAV